MDAVLEVFQVTHHAKCLHISACLPMPICKYVRTVRMHHTQLECALCSPCAVYMYIYLNIHPNVDESLECEMKP